MAILETLDLTKKYGRLTAVDSVSLVVEKGQVFGFLGPNGSGKTTTIGMLLGIITPTGGGFRLFGRDGTEELHAARRRIGATLETPNFYPYLSGRDNLRIAAQVKGVEEHRIPEALEIVGLAGRQSDAFRKYSLGMKQRLALAATMLGDPDLIILDEPANGLDPEGMREVREIILALASRGATIFLSSHLLWEVERTCTHVAILRSGRVVRQSAVGDLVAGATVVSVAADDGEALRLIVAEYPPATGHEERGDRLIVHLADDDAAALNRFAHDRGVTLSHLAVEKRTLEDVFIEATAPGAGGAT
ncbi:MAG TPA: ABC transporter ATP-binding protein [Gemmatimonadaceae bacterium]